MENLDDEIKKAKRSEGYLILITRLNNKRLTHTWFTNSFDRNDIPISLAHYNQSLKREMGATVSEEPIIDEKKRQLPPEYRPKVDIPLEK